MEKRKKRLSMKDQYRAMTRLGWETTYQDMDKVFPYDQFEGIKIHDWEAWEDPFRMTMDAYWKFQAEKDKKLYAIIDSFAQNNAQKNLTDASYLSALKLFLTGVSPAEYQAHRGFAHIARHFRGDGPRVACQMQAIDELRHIQTQVHTMSHYNRHFNGFSEFPHWHDRVWYLSVPKSFFDDARTAGPFEFIVAIGFSFEYVLTNLLFVPFMSGAAFNGDMATVSFGFSAQSDEARHMTLGLQAIKFMLEQDPGNVPIVQRWIDKWTWRGYRVLVLVAAMMDYMLPESPQSWKEAWELYFEQNTVGLFNDLAKYGIKVPDCVDRIKAEKEHASHQVWMTFYTHGAATAMHTWIPDEKKQKWLSEKYPETFDKYYKPVYDHWKERADKGDRYYSQMLPHLCQVCQVPVLFTETESDEPMKFHQRQTIYKEERYHFCSDHCQHIFENEPEKYVYAWMPVQQIFQGNCGGPTIPDVLNFYKINDGIENRDYKGSEDEVAYNMM
ncbi:MULTISPECIES: YHS domain-containing protein [Sphingobacterium]|uniref:YHS domain-containing protein n=1 Tax=Sphingobacterium TaxID=28453 RepID=UPI001C557D49|nr:MULTISPECIES: YHS domain-containing protein [Sphingobacterium]MCT1530536.1 YHS domain-containing protein [Sphingobacterium daejeonense]